MMSRRVKVAVHADEMALLEQLVKGVDAPNPQHLVHAMTEVRIIEHHVQSQWLGPQGRCRADPAAADQPQRLAPQPGSSDGRLVVPGARADCLVARHQPANQGQQEHDRVVGDFLGSVVGHVAHDHAVAAGRRPIDVVIAHTGSNHALAPWCPGKAGLSQVGNVRKSMIASAPGR